MATDRNVYELIDEYVALGQVMKNVYFYQIGPALSFNAQDLCDDWVANILPTIQNAQETSVVHTRVSARNLFDTTETGEILHSVTGVLGGAGDDLPPFVSAGITLARADASTRSGKKRIYVGGESYQDNGVWVGTLLTALANIAADLADKITVTAIDRWFPVIVKRILVAVDEYRLPETAAEAIINGVVGGLASSIVTTQNSRKIGVGS